MRSRPRRASGAATAAEASSGPAQRGLQRAPSSQPPRPTWEALLTSAHDQQADALVCGARGRSGFARTLLGSTSTSLASPRRPAARRRARRSGRARGPLLIAYDGSGAGPPDDRVAGRPSAFAAALRGARLGVALSAPASRVPDAGQRAPGERTFGDHRRFSSSAIGDWLAATTTGEGVAHSRRGRSLTRRARPSRRPPVVWRSDFAPSLARRARHGAHRHRRSEGSAARATLLGSCPRAHPRREVPIACRSGDRARP